MESGEHKIGDMVFGYHSGLGIILSIKYETTIDSERLLMYLVKHFKTGEESWHLSIGIDKMKAMYQKVISEGKYKSLFDMK